MTDTLQTERSMLEDLKLVLKMRDGDYCAGRVGVALVLYYGKPMKELIEAAKRLVDCYLNFIPEGTINSQLSTSGVWRAFTRQALTKGLRRLGDEGADYASIHLSSGEPRHTGEYGFHFYGSNFLESGVRPRETCACICQFPLGVTDGEGGRRFVDFVAQMADLEPFDSGYAGLAFNHLFETWRSQVLAWIAQRAPRYAGIDIGYDALREVARQRVVSASWLTLLGSALVQELGGDAKVRERLPAGIANRPLQHGAMLIAGDHPPVGDVNRGAKDLTLVKEVARLTKPVRARMVLRFGGESFRNGWLDRLD